VITGELKSKIDRVWDASQQLVLLDEVASDGWRVGVTLPMLELARLRIRGLVRFVEPTLRNPVYNKQLTAHDLAPLSRCCSSAGPGGRPTSTRLHSSRRGSGCSSAPSSGSPVKLRPRPSAAISTAAGSPSTRSGSSA